MLGGLVTPADEGDREGAKALLRRSWLTLPRLSPIWADGNYDGPLVEWLKTCWGFDLEIVIKPEGQKGFSVSSERLLGPAAPLGGRAHVCLAGQTAAALERL